MRTHADVLAVQEVMDNGDFKALIEGTEYASFARSPIDRSPGIERQQVILSRFGIRKVHLHRQETKVSWVHANRGVAQAVHWNLPIVEPPWTCRIGPTASSPCTSSPSALRVSHGSPAASGQLASHAEASVPSAEAHRSGSRGAPEG